MRAAYAPGILLSSEGHRADLIELGLYNLSDVLAYLSRVKQSPQVPLYNIYLDGMKCAELIAMTGKRSSTSSRPSQWLPGCPGLVIYTAMQSQKHPTS